LITLENLQTVSTESAATAPADEGKPTEDPAASTAKPRRRRRRWEPVPDWASLGRRMSVAERTELNSAHKVLDDLSRRLLVRVATRCLDPTAMPAAERLVAISTEIPWMG
jgi:hypothetical protein